VARETKTDLLERIERLRAENQRLAANYTELFDEKTALRMRAIELEEENAELRKRLAELEAQHGRALTEELPQNPKRGRPCQITPETKERVRAMREGGCSMRTIAGAVGVSVSTVHGILKEM